MSRINVQTQISRTIFLVGHKTLGLSVSGLRLLSFIRQYMPCLINNETYERLWRLNEARAVTNSVTGAPLLFFSLLLNV